jgi:hypothetical protein
MVVSGGSICISGVSKDGVEGMVIGDKILSIIGGVVTVNGRRQKDEPNEPEVNVKWRRIAFPNSGQGMSMTVGGVPLQIVGDDVFVNHRRQVDAE